VLLGVVDSEFVVVEGRIVEVPVDPAFTDEETMLPIVVDSVFVVDEGGIVERTVLPVTVDSVFVVVEGGIVE
jgi:hypothetical protein